MLNKKLNKKAQVPEGMLWIIRILFIIIPLVIAISFFLKAAVVNLDVNAIEAVILTERIQNCFSDELGVINAERFNSDELRKCYAFGEEGAIKADLFFGTEQLEAETDKFSFLNPLCDIPKGNIPYCNTFRKYALVEKEDELYPGSLDVKILLIR